MFKKYLFEFNILIAEQSKHAKELKVIETSFRRQRMGHEEKVCVVRGNILS